MSEPHLSRLVLQRLSVDDLGGETRARAEAHVAGCDGCREALAALHEGTRAYTESRTPEHFMMQLTARRAREGRRRTAIFGTLGSVLAVAAALLLWVRPGPDPLRMKGGGLDVLRKRAGVVVTLGPDDRIRAGDALELSLTRTGVGKLAAWAVDSSGRVDALTEGVVTIAPGATLPSSAVVEAPCRDLSLVIVDRPPYALPDVAAVTKRQDDGAPLPAGVLVRRLRCE